MLSGFTSSRPSQWHWRRPLTTALKEVSGATCTSTKPHGDRGPPVQRPRTMLHGARRRVWPGISSSSRCMRKNSGARGLTDFTRSGRKTGYSGAPWSRSSTTRSSCRRLMFLCRRWKTDWWWKCASSSILSCPSRLSQCPRSPLPVILTGAVCVLLSRRQNSWWKCRRSYPTLRYAGLWSKMFTFQFFVVAEIFLLQRRLLVCRVRQIKGFFALFPERKCDVGSALGVGTGYGYQLIHAGGSAGGFLHGSSWCVDAVSRWLVETSGLGPRSLAAWVKAGTGPRHASAYDYFWKPFLFFVLVQFALGVWYIISVSLYLGVIVLGVWVMRMIAKIGFFWR